ncbi:MAG: hypothetical protein LW768_10850 [Rubrivivax sp.]|nr:hypothetical protein [Rubrivivax sp.]
MTTATRPLGRVQAAILGLLQDMQPRKPLEVQQALGITNTSADNALRTLAASGLVLRQPDGSYITRGGDVDQALCRAVSVWAYAARLATPRSTA